MEETSVLSSQESVADVNFKARFSRSFFSKTTHNIHIPSSSTLQSESRLSFWNFFKDELYCERIPRYTKTVKIVKNTASEKDSTVYDSIPKTVIRDLFHVPARLEKTLILGFFICLECVLYELTLMPVQAAIGLFKLIYLVLFSMIAYVHHILSTIISFPLVVNLFLSPFILKDLSCLYATVTRRLSMTIRHFSYTRHGRLPFFFVKRWGFYRFLFYHNYQRYRLSLPQACDLTRTVILIVGIFFFNRFFDVSAIYHFIRAQSFMKLYVIFNMLELFERLWRSLGRDAMDSLMRQIVSLSVVDHRWDSAAMRPEHGLKSLFSNPLTSSLSTTVFTRSGTVPIFRNCPQDASLLQTLRAYVLYFSSFWDGKLFNYVKDRIAGSKHFITTVRLSLSIALVLVYVVVHGFTHLLRGLLLNISMNSSESVMFFILTSNNFAELKSTVFKKYSKIALFSIVASDAVERFYLFTDGIILLLRLASSVRAPLTPTTSIVFWLAGMFALECLVDWAKHFFLLKLNFLPTNTLNLYREALWADILICRSTKDYQTRHDKGTEHSLMQWRTPCRSFYSFPHICSRRVGFVALPLTAQFICLLTRFPWKEHFYIVVLTTLLLWCCLLLIKQIVSIVLIFLATRQRSTLTVQCYPELNDLSPL